MSLTIELRPEAAAQLTVEAGAQGLSTESYASGLLQAVLASERERRMRLDKEQFQMMLEYLAASERRRGERAGGGV